MSNYTPYTYNTDPAQAMSEAFTTLMRNVYLWMSLGLIMTGMTAWYVAMESHLIYSILQNSFLFIGLMVSEIFLVVLISARIKRMSMLTAGLMFALYSIINGITLSVIFLVYSKESIAQTFFITAGTFGVMSAAGYFVKKDLSIMGQMLMMTLLGLILATIVNLFLHSSGLSMILNYLGVLIFVGLTAYDTQKIKMMLQSSANEHGVSDETTKIALVGSLMLYLDFINLFLHLLRILKGRD